MVNYSYNNQIISICNNEYDVFFMKPNVVGVSLGYKVKNGVTLSEPSIQVLVTKKIPECQLSSDKLIVKNYKGIKTDVIETGEIFAQGLTAKIRPMLFGYSISPRPINYLMAGTAGCLVKDQSNFYILSNNHVLAGENTLGLNTPIIQPGSLDGGRYPNDTIAALSKFIPIQFETLNNSPSNTVDAAIARVLNISQVSSSIALIGKVNGISPISLNLAVKKSGRTTSLTTGKITNTNATIRIQYSNRKTALFKNQILTTAMSSAGDSGSLLVNSYNYAVGLLFAGSSSVTVYNPINSVLSALGVSLVTN